jgi:hypothetical protein
MPLRFLGRGRYLPSVGWFHTATNRWYYFTNPVMVGQWTRPELGRVATTTLGRGKYKYGATMSTMYDTFTNECYSLKRAKRNETEA